MVEHLSCSLITYEQPPIVEVALSVQFVPPEGLTPGHLGAFWGTVKDDFPKVSAHQPIPDANETFEGVEHWIPPSIQFSLSSDPDHRLQMLSLDEQWMCQIQQTRLVVNWRKKDGEYPRFLETWKRFQDILSKWERFLLENQVGAISPGLWELTYVNQIAKNTIWDSPSDWPTIFPGLWGGEFLPQEGTRFMGFRGQWVWDSIQSPARLYVEAKSARTVYPVNSNSNEALHLNLVARGAITPVESNSRSDPGLAEVIQPGVFLGHNLIVETFDQISSETAKKYWGRHDSSNEKS